MPKCPECSKQTTWEGNKWRPFCSERCKMLDLGKWTDGQYVISTPNIEDDLDSDEITVPEHILLDQLRKSRN